MQRYYGWYKPCSLYVGTLKKTWREEGAGGGVDNGSPDFMALFGLHDKKTLGANTFLRERLLAKQF